MLSPVSWYVETSAFTLLSTGPTRGTWRHEACGCQYPLTSSLSIPVTTDIRLELVLADPEYEGLRFMVLVQGSLRSVGAGTGRPEVFGTGAGSPEVCDL